MGIPEKNSSLRHRHPASSSLMRRLSAFALVILTQLAYGSLHVAAQQQESYPKNWAWIDIQLRSPGRAEVGIYLHPSPDNSTVIINEIKLAMGCESLESARSALQEAQQTGIESEEHWSRDFWCDGTMLRKGLAGHGVFDPAPLLHEARSRGLDSLDVLITYYGPATLSLQAPPSWAEGSAYYRFHVPVDASPQDAIRLRAGYSPHDVAGMILPALALLLVPLALMLWIRRALLREADTARPSPAWFGYWRCLQWNMLGAFLLWFAAIGYLKFGPFLKFVFDIDSENRMTVLQGACYAILMFLPPAVINVICTALYNPVFRRLPGVQWSKHEVFEQAVWTQMANLVPLALIVAALSMLSVYNLEVAALTLFAALFARILGARQLHSVTTRIVPPALLLAAIVAALFVLPDLDNLDLALFALLAGLSAALFVRILRGLLTFHREPHALRNGELRDRAFALAKKAGAKLKRLYVLPTAKGPTPNVCERQGNAIMLTDYLLEHLSRREVDAILAHELAHLKRRHPVLLSLPIIAALGFGYWGEDLGVEVRGLPYGAMFPLCLMIGLGMFLLLKRRFEGSADAAALRLTNDPESLISALAKLDTLNRMPLQWRRFQSSLITHPSIPRCAHRIARSTAIPEDRLIQIIDSSEAPSDHYAIPT